MVESRHKGVIAMLTLYRNIKLYRTRNGWSQEEMAKRVGYSDKSMVSKIERGKVDLSRSQMERFADVFGISLSELMGDDGTTLTTRVPVLGKVAAGLPIEAIENIIDFEEIPDEYMRKGEYFALVIKGDSMEPRMYDGDVVIVRKQNTAESGQIVIATVNGDDATCKRFMQYGDSIGLVSLNSKYPPMVYTQEQQKSLPIQIWGVVVEIRGKLLGI